MRKIVIILPENRKRKHKLFKLHNKTTRDHVQVMQRKRKK